MSSDTTREVEADALQPGSVAPQRLLLTVREAAKRLGIPEKQLRNLQLRGEIPYVPVGRRIYLCPTDLEQFIADRRVPAQPPRRRS